MPLNPDTQLPGKAVTVNEHFFDAMVRHQIGLLRMSKGLQKRTIAILDATEADLRDKILSRLSRFKGVNVPADVVRLQNLATALGATRAKAWAEVNELWVKELRDLARAEPSFVDGALKTVVPTTLETTLPSSALLTALATKSTFEGRTTKQWFQSISEADMRRIREAVTVGMTQGESAQQIARRVVGTKANRGIDGVTQFTRRNAEAVTRTLVNGVANVAKRAFYTENQDVIKREYYVATLDARTTPICRSLDGKIFEVGVGPIPPRHVNCRSLRVALIDDEAIGNRPAKASTERILVRDFAKRNNLGSVSRRSALPRGTKADYDKFARREIRRRTGRVPAKVNYQEWLTRQSAEFQDDVLGVTRAKLFRRGGLKLDKFVNRAGDELPLSALASKNRSAFRAAGLDPEDFI